MPHVLQAVTYNQSMQHFMKLVPCMDNCFLCKLLFENGRNLFPCCSELIFAGFSSFTWIIVTSLKANKIEEILQHARERGMKDENMQEENEPGYRARRSSIKFYLEMGREGTWRMDFSMLVNHVNKQ